MTKKNPFAFETTSPITTPFSLSRNEAVVIKLLHKSGAVSRTTIASITRWSKAKVTYEVDNLINRGLLIEVDEGQSSGGRRPRLVSLNNALGYLVGIDIGATTANIALADAGANILRRDNLLVEMRDGPKKVLDEITSCILQLIAQVSIEPAQIIGIGIGVPGPVNYSRGILVNPPLMPGWGGFLIREFFGDVFPSARVVVDNDTNIMALGELYAGAGVGIDNFIYVKIGTGIGAGIVFDNKIHRGANGSAGGFGHICIDRNGPPCYCGRNGCLEGVAGAPAIVARAVKEAQSGRSPILAKIQQSKNGILQLEDITLAASEGDLPSIEIIKSSGNLIGEVLATLVNFFDPKLILLGGRVSILDNQLLASIRQTVLIRSNTLATVNLIIKFSPMGNDAGVMGAIHLALENLFVVIEA